MTREEKIEALKEFSDLCDQARACITGEPYRHTEIEISLAEEKPVAIGSADLQQLSSMVLSCQRCRLCQGRNHAVVGEGAMHPLLMVIGEGPGADEDATGRPFVGRSGQFLDSWLSPIGLSRQKNVYIANIVKCRPPQNRTPLPDEVELCVPYVKRQVQLVRPQAILLSGVTAAHAMLGRVEGVGRLREQTFQLDGIPTVVTYHPAGVLRNPTLKRDVWNDIKRIAGILRLPILRGR